MGVKRAFGATAAVWYSIFQAGQFHIIYYASRTLPNMFAFGLCKYIPPLGFLPSIDTLKARWPFGIYFRSPRILR